MRFYLDTSVFGGFYDPEFSDDTEQLFEEIVCVKIKVVYSYLTQKELEGAPKRVRRLVDRIPAPKYVSDAQHIAVATIQGVNTLVSWNFRHMVNFFRIQQYNSINLRCGYKTIDIRSVWSQREVVWINIKIFRMRPPFINNKLPRGLAL